MQDSRNPLFGFLYVGKDIHVGRMSEETWFPYMGYKCDLCSCSTSWWWFSRPTVHWDGVSCVCVSQAYTCRVPNVVKNVWQIDKW